MMAERAIGVDHSTVHRWVIKLGPLFKKTFRKHKRPVGKSWRVDETYIKVKGSWKYLYRAVDKAGSTIDFPFRAKRDRVAARRFFEKAIAQNGSPEMVTIDESGSNLAALHAVNAERETPIEVRQVKYLNKVVEKDHRAIERRTRPMLRFKDFDCARVILSGIEVMHMIKKGQMRCAKKSRFLPSTSSTFSIYKRYITIAFARPSCLAATERKHLESLQAWEFNSA
jgi:transposase-like protein